MARVLKRFNTEQEYEEWANGPDMRTPYTCLVEETGKVHFFSGDENDYSVTIIAKDDGVVKLCSRSIAPQFDSHNNFLNEGLINRITLNGEIIFDKDTNIANDYERLFGTYYMDDPIYGALGTNAGYNDYHNDIIHPNRTHSFVSSTDCEYARNHIFLRKNDIVKLFLSTDDIPKYAFHNCGNNVKEYIIGDGIRKIRYMAFGNRTNVDTTIFVGKNVCQLNSACFNNIQKVIFNTCNVNKRLKCASKIDDNNKIIENPIRRLKFMYKPKRQNQHTGWWMDFFSEE